MAASIRTVLLTESSTTSDAVAAFADSLGGSVTVTESESVAEVLDAIDGQRVDAVFVDANTPGTDSDPLTSIRNESPNLPVVLIAREDTLPDVSGIDAATDVVTCDRLRTAAPVVYNRIDTLSQLHTREQQTQTQAVREREQQHRVSEILAGLEESVCPPLERARDSICEPDFDAAESDDSGVEVNPESAPESAVEQAYQSTIELIRLGHVGAPVSSPDPVDLQSAATDVWETLETDGATLDVEANLSVPASRPALKVAFRQLFENTLSHAVNDPDADGAYANLTVSIAALPSGDGFYVQDNGTGLPDHVDHSDVSSPGVTTADSGTGLGLTTVSRVARSHDWVFKTTQPVPDDGFRAEFKLQ